ncbi:hypothetical protein [Hoeflea sp.]|uniref:hypothetical protein n=1 Tax=Hoeflea sp. TaxID=1940281 RepID=UPI003A9562E3
MYMDRTTEAIAHFIGLFAITIEQAWQRQAFDSFTAEALSRPDPNALPDIETSFSADYELLGYEPGFVYRAPAPELFLANAESFVHFGSLKIPLDSLTYAAYLGSLFNLGSITNGIFTYVTNYNIVPVSPEAVTLGSVANFINQGIALHDDDYFGVGAHGLGYSPAPFDDMQLISLVNAANALSPFTGNEILGSSEALTAFATDLLETLDDYEPLPQEGQAIFVEKQNTIEGIYVNGEKVDEAPKLDDYFSLEDRLDAAPHSDKPLPHNASLTDDGWQIDTSVEVETGGNILINNVVMKNFWTASTVTAVVGDHIQINAIVQINAWADTDIVSEAIAGWDKNPVGTQAFNIATFERLDSSADNNSSEPANGFPKHWVVSEVDGDLLIVNWLQQLTFMHDNDIGVLSSSGATTAVYSGNNISYNDVSIYELGLSYDLIIIGGNCYDLNIIQQMNLLYDNDSIGAVTGFETTGEGHFSTSDNLLWNNAAIYNIGGAGQFEALPDYYRATADALAAGQDFLSDGVLSDAAFAGLGTLRVLYIKGDFINVQYAKMTNILGDSDQIALAMDAVGAHPEADWSVTTGANALINNATLVDLDSMGTTYVGGDQYSSDVLIQADIISTDPHFGSQNPDVLVNEAIYFLDDDGPDNSGDQYAGSGSLDPDNADGDALQTLIG